MTVETMLDEVEENGEKPQQHIYLLDSATIGLMSEAEDGRWSRGKTATDEEEEE